MEVNQAHPNARDGVKAFNINESVQAPFIVNSKCSQSAKPTTIARPLGPNTIAHFHWTFWSIIKFLHHFLPQCQATGSPWMLLFHMLKWWNHTAWILLCPAPHTLARLMPGWWFQPIWKIYKNISQIIIGWFPQVGVKIKCLKPPPRCILTLAMRNDPKCVHVHSRSQPSVTSCIWSSTTCIAHEDAMWCQAYCSATMWNTWCTPQLLTMKPKSEKMISKVWISPFPGSIFRFITLSKFNIAPEKWGLEDDPFLLRRYLWGVYIWESFRCLNIVHGHPHWHLASIHPGPCVVVMRNLRCLLVIYTAIYIIIYITN